VRPSPRAAHASLEGTDVGPTGPLVGVLALQGDVAEHVAALERCGARTSRVRGPDDLTGLDAIVLPGGESTAIGRLLVSSGLRDPLRAAVADGLPVYATCAGLILLADEVDVEAGTPRLGGLAVRVERNAFGRQVDSFDTTIAVTGLEGGPLDVSFIRAPRIAGVLAPSVQVLATLDGAPVIVRQGSIVALACHPEVAGDDRLLARFLDDVVAGGR
jgi:pyridoxal 5'-phosphate synthase pdxT subunit